MKHNPAYFADAVIDAVAVLPRRVCKENVNLTSSSRTVCYFLSLSFVDILQV